MSPDRHENWKQYQQLTAPVLQAALFLFAAATLVSGVYQILNSMNHGIFPQLNLITAGVSFLMGAFPRYTSLTLKITIATLLGLMSIAYSLIFSGLIGTAFLTIFALHTLYLTVSSPGRALGFLGFTVLLFLLFPLIVGQAYVEYGISHLNRMNSPQQWLTRGIALAFTSGFAAFAIILLKRRLLGLLRVQQKTNTRLQQREDELKALAYTDPVTGLPNKMAFEKELHSRSHAGTLGEGYIIVLEIYNFRIVNSLIGPAKADLLLEHVGRLLKSYSSESNFIARYNGVEFVGWAGGWSESDLYERVALFSNRMKQIVREQFPEITLDIRAAASAYPRDGESIEECYKNAGIALYRSEGISAAAVVLYDPAMKDYSSEEMILRSALEEAIEQDEFLVYYQKKISLKDSRLIGLEALTRWQDAASQFVSPMQFIPILNKYHLMNRFGYLILEKVLKDVPEIDARFGADLHIAINISPSLFLDPGFPEFLIAAVHNEGIDPRRIILEITEDVFIEDISKLRQIVEKLKAESLRISLDDFGTGFSSLSYISNLQLDELKVDKSFIDDIHTNGKKFGIFSSICTIGHLLGYTVVAEGVESEAQLTRLLDTDCDIAQGFYFAVPAPVIEL